MGYPALTSFLDARRVPPSGIVVTAVLEGGCPMECPFCIVNMRDERREKSYLTVNHYTALMAGLDRRQSLGGAAVVGDEPLQTHCWPTAKTFLTQVSDRGLPTAIITNAFNLIDFVEELELLENTKVVVSLDAASKKHDKIRRKPGAFARIEQGIKAATARSLRKRLSVASILMPSNLPDIEGVISFTAKNEIPQLVLSPLLTSSRTEPLAVHPRILKQAAQALPQLLTAASAAGVMLRFSDEFAILGNWEKELAATGIQIMTPQAPARLIRIDAAGRIETFASMRSGTTTGLRLPEDISDIEDFVDVLLEQCFEPARVAA